MDRDAAVAVVRGPEHPLLGETSTFALDARLAGTTSAGRFAKDPPSHEPNEDGFLLRRHGGRVALLVLDGAGGFQAAEAVLDTLDRALVDLLDQVALPSGAPGVWASALRARDMSQMPDPVSGRRSHVAVSLALVEEDGATWCATTGDTAVLAVHGGAVRILSGVAPHLDHHAPLPQPQQVRLSEGTVLVGVTDGFFDALGPAWASVVLDGVQKMPGSGAAAVSAHLVGAALEAGGPDHVTVVVHAR